MTEALSRHILLSQNLGGMLPRLQERYPDCRFTTVPDDGDFRDEYLDAEALLRSSMGERVFNDILLKCDDLRWVQITAAGFDWIGGDILAQRLSSGLTLTRSANSYNVPIAEYVIGAVLMASRRFPELRHAQERREWVRLVATDVIGSTMMLFGTGAIGREVACRAKALGVRVVGVNRDGRPVDGFDGTVARDRFDQQLGDADWVVLAMPLTSETHGMIGSPQFAAMKDSAILVNVGRGALVAEDALIEAMRNGHIAGAFLDAFEVEPLPADSILWGLPNTVVTPHTSFRGSGNIDRLYADFCANFDRYLAGQALDGTMKQPRLGY